MKMIDSTGAEWRKLCMQCAQAREDFLVTGYLKSDVLFLRNLGSLYHYNMVETAPAFYFRIIFKN